jgi:predicted outer membrane repeat protein
MTKTEYPNFCTLMGLSGKTAFRLALFVMLFCFGQEVFASGWGGLKLTRPDGGTENFGKGSGNGAVSGSYEVDSNAGLIGTAKAQSDYTTSACGISSSVTGSGGCSGSGSDSGGCGDANASANITITNNATTACSIAYYANADSNSSITRTQTIKIKQYVDWSSFPTVKAVTDPAYTVTAYGRNAQTGTSGLPPTYTSNTTSVCTVNSSSGLVTNLTIGLCRISATTGGDGNWAAGASTYREWYVKTGQTITVTQNAPATAVIGASFNVAATASSGLAVEITASGVCTVTAGGSGSATINISGAGTCTVFYNQPGNNFYFAAAQVSQNTTASKLNQTITFPAQSAQNYANGGTFPINPLATASSGFLVAYTTATPAICTLTGIGNDEVVIVSAGTCTINANQSGNANYNAAPQVSRNITINKIGQTITVTTPAPATAEAGGSFNVAATSSSGLAVAITVSGSCTIGSGGSGSATINATIGTCTVYYNQAGNSNYNAAAQISSNTSVTKLLQTITVSTPAPALANVGSSFGVVASSNSGLGVSITTSGGCTGAGTNTATITLTSGTVTCTIKYNQAGNGTYEAASEKTNLTNAIRINQSITVTTPPPANAVVSATFNVAATASSGLSVAITTSGGCTGSGSNSASITMTSATSSCTVLFAQAGNGDYYPATSISVIVQDGTVPVITQTTAVPSPTNSTPQYVFNSSEAGSIVYGGACTSVTTFASAGSNTVIFEDLAEGTYSNCTIKVVDAAGNESNQLNLSAFTVVGGMVAYVKPIATGTGDCSSWANACANLQTAINISAVDQIWMMKGIYRPSATIILRGDVAIYGGFSGNETSYVPSNISTTVDYNSAGWSVGIAYGAAKKGENLTIISGDKDNNDVINSKGLVLFDADVNGTNLSQLFSATNLTLNTAKRVKLSGLILNAARGTSNGAAIAISNSYVEIDRTQFIFNKGAAGGAISVTNGGKVLAVDTVFLKNESTGAGGAISSTGSSSNVIQLQNDIFESNIAGTNGGAISNGVGRIWVLNNTFFGNSLVSTTGKGGAIDLASLVYPGSASIKYSTFVKNIAGTAAAPNGRGGAIHVNTAANAVVTLANSLVVDNSAAAAANIADMAKVTDSGYNIVGFNGISGMVSGTGAVDNFEFTTTSVTAPTVFVEDILDVVLANNGGYTGTLKLKENSYARDKIPGIHADCDNTMSVGKDQRGYVRPDKNGGYCDIGAMELDNLDPCKDPNREQGFFMSYYPSSKTACLANGGLSLSAGVIHPFYFVLLAIIGLRLRVRKKLF